jgi:hypothetical protein
LGSGIGSTPGGGAVSDDFADLLAIPDDSLPPTFIAGKLTLIVFEAGDCLSVRCD